jgi:hypothetical protein
MIGEFLNNDFRVYAAALFFTGLATLLFYYIKTYLLKKIN